MMNRIGLFLVLALIGSRAYSIDTDVSLDAAYAAPDAGLGASLKIGVGGEKIFTEALSLWGRARLLSSLSASAPAISGLLEAETSLRKDFSVLRAGGTAKAGWEGALFSWEAVPRLSASVGSERWSLFSDHSVTFSSTAGGFSAYRGDIGTYLEIMTLFLKPSFFYRLRMDEGARVASIGPALEAELFASANWTLDADGSLEFSLDPPSWAADASVRFTAFLPAGFSVSSELAWWHDSAFSLAELSANVETAWAFAPAFKARLTSGLTRPLIPTAEGIMDPLGWEIGMGISWTGR
jgi:hypothetical protein